jgi:hypothetical protein
LPANLLRVAAMLAIGSWAYLSIGCSPTVITIGLEAAADSILLGQHSLAEMAASGEGDPREVARASTQLSSAAVSLRMAATQIRTGVDPLTVSQILDELSAAAALLVPAPWGPLIRPIIMAVYSAVELIIHHIKGPGGLAPRMAHGGAFAKPFKVSMGDRAVISRVEDKLNRAEAISQRIPGK